MPRVSLSLSLLKISLHPSPLSYSIVLSVLSLSASCARLFSRRPLFLPLARQLALSTANSKWRRSPYIIRSLGSPPLHSLSPPSPYLAAAAILDPSRGSASGVGPPNYGAPYIPSSSCTPLRILLRSSRLGTRDQQIEILHFPRA